MTPLVLLMLLAPAGVVEDDVVPAAIEAQLALPDTPFPSGAPLVPGSAYLANLALDGTVRASVPLGDVNGDGASDLALGLGPDAQRALLAVDGRDGSPLWSRAADGRTVRGRRALDVAAGRLALGLCGPGARVELRAAADGLLLWARDLAPGAASANVLSVELVPDRDGDGLPEVLCAGGVGAQLVALLAGADGSPLWTAATAGPCAAARLGADPGGAGGADVLAVGGLATPFAMALDGDTGATRWQVALPAPGSVALPHADLDGDGTPDLLVGLFAAPAPCLRALSGASGALLWEAVDIDHDVTALAAVSDVDADGLADVCVASFDHAMTCIGASAGQKLWRQETSDANGGSLLDVVAIGDGDGNGFLDVLAPSLDERAYVFDGRIGVLLLLHEARVRGVVSGTLPDGDGDGRPELVVGGQRALDLLEGSGGLLSGPIIDLKPAATLEGETMLRLMGYPTSQAWVLASVGAPAALAIPGFEGLLAVDLSAFGVLIASKVPGTGGLTTVIPPLPREALGLVLQIQGVTAWQPGQGQIGLPVEWRIGG